MKYGAGGIAKNQANKLKWWLNEIPQGKAKCYANQQLWLGGLI